MKNTINWNFTIILLIVGFMIAVQYNTIKDPKERDTRDIWAIRNELSTEKQLHSELLTEIRELDKTITTYESSEEKNAGKALEETVDKLYYQAGMVDAKGPGIVIDVHPSQESIAYGIPIDGISPDLLTRFVNEVNKQKALFLEIDGKRYTTLSAIRDINGKTTVNGLNVSTPPFQIKIITSTYADSEKLYNYLLSSTIFDDFYLDNLTVSIGEPKADIEMRGWIEKYDNLYLNEIPKGE
ncbi:DUF881 domain-containing protein [Sporosarcina sp. CAU 1771]